MIRQRNAHQKLQDQRWAELRGRMRRARTSHGLDRLLHDAETLREGKWISLRHLEDLRDLAAARVRGMAAASLKCGSAPRPAGRPPGTARRAFSTKE